MVASAISLQGAAVAFIAYDRLVPASAWLRGNAPQILAQSGVDIGQPKRIGRSIQRGLRLVDLRRLDPELSDDVLSYISWFDTGHYVIGVQAWLGAKVEATVIDPVLASLQIGEG